MMRMNLRDVPDDGYAELAQAAAARRQSLNALVVDRLAEAARAARLVDYLAAYSPPAGTELTVADAVAAARQVREAS